MGKNTFFVFISSILLFFAVAQNVLAGSANLNWNANTESDLAGYKIYYGKTPRTSSCPVGGYTTTLDVGKVTSYTINNLTDGSTYYFSITAYDTGGKESCFSEERSKTLPVAGNTSDLNSDGKVNSVDFGILMSSWGSTAKPKADINQDGFVNSVDFGIMMSKWNTLTL